MHMATIKKQKIYRCNDDCIQAGCPGHVATLTIQTTSDAYSFEARGFEPKHFERNELQTLMDLLKEVDRADTVRP